MKSKSSRNAKRAAIVAGGLALSVVGGGIAFAYWTTPGSGTGSASTGSTVPVTINAAGAPVTGLYPGGPAKSISGNFKNPNPGKVRIQQVTVAISSVAGGADRSKPACTAADFTLTQPRATNAEIASGPAVGAWGPATIAMKNTSANQDNCKNATVRLAFTSN